MSEECRLTRSAQTGHELATRRLFTPYDQHVRASFHQCTTDHRADALGAARHHGGLARNGEEGFDDAHAVYAFAMLSICSAV